MSSTNIRRLLVTALGGITAATLAAGAVALSAPIGTGCQSTVALNSQPLPPGIHHHKYSITLAAAHKSPGRNKVASLPPAS